MKKLISICMVLCLTCVCLFTTVSAADLTYPDIPEDVFENWFIMNPRPDYTFLYVIPSGVELTPYFDPMDEIYVLSGDMNAYQLVGDTWEFLGSEFGVVYFDSSLICSGYDVYADDGTFLASGVIAGDSGNDDALADGVILPSAIPDGALGDVLGEVVRLSVIVIPVVVGLFGIRKGISFVIGRIRGV